MQGITEYCKAFNNDYPFVYQDMLSNNFSNELFDVVKEYETNLTTKIKGMSEVYEKLKNEPIHRSPSNYSLLYDFDNNRIAKCLYKYFMMSNQIGGEQAHRDFKSDIEYSPTLLDSIKLAGHANERSILLKSSYKNFILGKLKTSFKKEHLFAEFTNSVLDYKNFSKRDSHTPYIPFNPDAKLSVENMVTTSISKFSSDSRIGVYNKTERVEKFIYKTRDDERVSSICRPWHNRVLDPGNTTGIIPQHRNCRCSIVPFT